MTMIRRLPASWDHALLICGKCARRAGKPGLAKRLRKAAGLKKGRKAPVGVVEIGCQDICPKRAIVAIDTRRPGEWLLLPADQSVPALAAALGLESDSALNRRRGRVRAGAASSEAGSDPMLEGVSAED